MGSSSVINVVDRGIMRAFEVLDPKLIQESTIWFTRVLRLILFSSGEEEFSSSIFSMSGNTCIQHGFKGIPICQKLIKMQSQLDSANASHNRLADLYYLLSK